MLKMFVFIDVWFVKQDIKKMVKYKYMQFFYGEFEIEQKEDKKITFRSGDSNPRFSVTFPPMIWIFMEGEGDKIKSRQGSWNFSTLRTYLLSTCCRGIHLGMTRGNPFLSEWNWFHRDSFIGGMMLTRVMWNT